MNHACECGHEPGQHYGETGHCEAEIELKTWESAPCNCPKYQWQGDE